ncbi:hypothetical protein D3C86_1321400 [compost metagenome]
MKTIHSKALRLVKAYRKGKREVPEGVKDLKAFARSEISEMLGDGDEGAQAELLLELLQDPEWVGEAGECEIATGLPFFSAVVELLESSSLKKVAHLEMRLVKIHDAVVAATYKVIKDGFEVTAAGLPKLRVRHFKDRAKFSGLGAAHGVVYATIEYDTPADAFSRIAYLCWAPQRVL